MRWGCFDVTWATHAAVLRLRIQCGLMLGGKTLSAINYMGSTQVRQPSSGKLSVSLCQLRLELYPY